MAPNPSVEEVREQANNWYSVHPPEHMDDAWLAWACETGEMLVIRREGGTTYSVELYHSTRGEHRIGTVVTVHDTTYDGTSAQASARRFRA